MENNVYFLKVLKASYIHSGIGSRSVPIGSLSDENVISFQFLKFSSGRMLQH